MSTGSDNRPLSKQTALAPPKLPPRYEPLAPLGKGGGGVVWSVRDRITGRTLALKALAEGANEREVLALVREAVALSGVEGLGVPRVLRFGRLPGDSRSYLVRELVDGESLAELILRGGDPLVAIEAIAQATDQVTRLHRALLLHGDLKPANIIVGPNGRAALVDLGLAAKWREGGATPEGLTPRYAAPELFEGAPLTVRAEVFALGATVQEVLRSIGGGLDLAVLGALEEVASRAVAQDAAARYPSADELVSALRRAARLKEPPSHERGLVWPVVGLDGAAGRLLTHVGALRAGGGVVVSGPRQSGRTTLLRRIAWSLGVEGQAVVFVEASREANAQKAIDVELSAYPDLERVVALVDDADKLEPGDLERLDGVRKAGGKLVLVVGIDGGERALPGSTFEVFTVEPLSVETAGELVRRAIPSLSDAVVRHVVERAGRWPGRVRAIVEKLALAPVVAPEDVDRLLAEDSAPATERGDVHRLLDRGHYDEAADLLARYDRDGSPTIAIARARLHTNKGDAARALEELRRVEAETLGAPRADATAAAWLLAAARAHLRAGDYAEAERRAAELMDRLGIDFELSPPSSSGDAVATFSDELSRFEGLPRGVRPIAAEAAAVRGLSLSFASLHREARVTLDHAVRLARALGEPRILSVALGSLAFALQRNEQLAEAKAAYEAGLRSAEEAGDAGSVATMRLNLAGIAKSQGDLAGAIGSLEASVDMGKRSGRVATLRQALLNLANLDLYLGRVARARVSIDALAAERADLPPQQHAQLLTLEAEYAARSGDAVGAERLCQMSAASYEGIGRTLDAVEARLQGVLFAAGRAGADARALREAIGEAERALGDSTAHRPLLFVALGRVHALLGDHAAARAALDEALQSATSSGQKDWVWRALEARAQLALEAGQALKARQDREAALSVLEDIAGPLPRDLREVYWSDPRRSTVRSSCLLDFAGGATLSVGVAGQDRLARVLEINRAIAGEHDLARLLEKVTDHAIALLHAERGFVILRSGYGKPRRDDEVSDALRDTKNQLSIHAVRAEGADDPHARFSQSIAEKVIRTGEPVVTASASEDTRMADYVSVHQLMLQSVACVPIRARSSQVIGALYLETRLRPAGSFAEELPTLRALADQVAIAIETARLVGENERRALDLERANAELKAAQAKLEEHLGHRMAQLAATRRDLRSARAVIRGHFGYEGLVGTSDVMRRVYALVDRVKDTDVPVLITGESGTGKEVVARAIHNAGPRAKKPFVGINCGAIPEHLLESELFGHVRGAFTGADRDRRGLFREATEGTILLDEIGEMPQKMQAGLLRVLQERVVRPVGGSREEPVDTRVIAATHRDLASMVEARSFREDLYYRLHVIEVRVPPLRERIDDIPVLIDHFLGIFAARYNRERRSVSREALRRLMARTWPGNVRQLENVLLNAWVLSEKDELEVHDFELSEVRPLREPSLAPPVGRSETSLDAHKATERERILSALASCNWNRVKAAQIVGMPRRTFYRRLKEYGIQ
jgi:serine/threonine-protein kinase PknK